ncbi:hypothetical protein M9Y10_001559 [Tritrichomonas musculus]|uniref:Protein kinase domain-containing protein n=1 Tax=Tritrichomonas musculus TaxID=1915356 RepID=A0ABR2L7D2_9EUKA
MQKIQSINEYSDDEIVFEKPTDLEDIQSYEKTSNQYKNGSPNDFIYLGNPNRQKSEESLKYNVNYYYRKINDNVSFHIFRTVEDKENKNDDGEKRDFPPTEYLESIQKLKGTSLIKLVEYSVDERWAHFEYIPGGTLYEAIKYGRQFNSGDRFKILYGIAITINSLHEKNINHLDIRLESIVATTKNKPVLADVHMVVQSYKSREDYDDEYLPYLDPYFQSSDDSVRADIFAYGILMNLFIQRSVRPLEKENITNIKKAYQNFLNNKGRISEEERLKIYLEPLEIAFDSTDETDKKLITVSTDCLTGKIKNSADLSEELKKILNASYFQPENTNIENELKLTEDEPYIKDHNSVEFNFERSDASIVELSASNLNARDIWLINKSDEKKHKYLPARAAEASLYATLTNDFSLYEEILTTPYADKK